MDPLKALLARFQTARPGLTPDEITDALWLASYLPTGTPVGKIPTPQVSHPIIPEATSAETRLTQNVQFPQSESTPALDRQTALLDASDEIPVFPRTQAGTYADEVEGRRVVRATRVRFPKARALPNARALARALRPMMRRVPSRTAFLLDEEATAESLADQQLSGNPVFSPVLRSALERWLDVILVVDTSNSMVIWQETAREFCDLLAGLGAFRNVHLWWLDMQSPKAPRLYPATSEDNLPRWRPPREIVSSRHDRLILMLTDCVAPAWQDERMLRLLAEWGALNCVAILQMLPETMWHRTMMNPGDLLASAFLAGVPNIGLAIEAHPDFPPPYIAAEMLRERKKSRAVPIPVVALDPRSLGDYARIVAGLGRARVPAVDITIPPHPVPPPVEVPLSGDALALIERFQATADPVTQRLAGYLSLVPLNLSIIYLVRTVMLPSSQQSHLAEFLTSGLVYRCPEAEKAAGEPVFDFVRGIGKVGSREEGVRELLQRTVRESETLRIFQKMDDYLREEAGLGKSFAARIPDALGSETLILNERTLPFARIKADVLERMGLWTEAQHLRRRIEERKPGAITLLEETPAQPDVYFRPAWSPDGRLLAAPTRDGRILIWGLIDETRDIDLRILTVSRFGVNQVAWSPDGQYLAAVSFDHIARVWKYPDVTPIAQLKGNESDVRTVAFLPSNAERLIAAGTHDGTIHLWDILSQSLLSTLSPKGGAVNILQWLPDDRWLAFGCDDGTVGLFYSTEPSSLIHLDHKESVLSGSVYDPPLLYREHKGSVHSLIWDFARRRLVTGSSQGEILVWNFSGGALHLKRRMTVCQGVVNSLSFSHDGRVLASKSTDNTVRFWHADTFQYLDGFDEPTSGFTYASATFHPSKPVLATTGKKDHSIRFWNVDLDTLLAAELTELENIRRLLKAKSWVAADEETKALMLRLANKEKQGYLNLKDVEKISCSDLLTIDRLWFKYSEGKFGFTVQKQIFDRLPELEQRLIAGHLGWTNPELENKLYENFDFEWDNRYLNFSTDAPNGHLPSFKLFKPHTSFPSPPSPTSPPTTVPMPTDPTNLNRMSDGFFRLAYFQNMIGVVRRQWEEKESKLRNEAQADGSRLAKKQRESTISVFLAFISRLRKCEQGIEMMYLPGGTFRMGDIQGKGRENEKPVHEVTLDAFAIGRYPVTIGDFRRFVEATGYQTEAERQDGTYVYDDKEKEWGVKSDANWRNPYFIQSDNHPVVCISWNDAVAYCVWLSEQTGELYSLPTEAQWEYACRASSETAYCFGDDEKLLDKYACYWKNAGGKTHPVGEKQANAWGLYDMHGNVWEWVQDWYGAYSSEPQLNPSGPMLGTDRVFRGGSCGIHADGCRSAYRGRGSPGGRIGDLGFRLARRV